MSNFRFDYNDIHKQVAIADLTNESSKIYFLFWKQKKYKTSQLTGEERAFFSMLQRA